MGALDRNLLTPAQAEAIAEQTMVYYSDDAPNAVGLAQPPRVITDADKLSVYAGALTDGMVAVEFAYNYTYADGNRAEQPGLEVTVYATDGTIVTSQDYG